MSDIPITNEDIYALAQGCSVNENGVLRQPTTMEIRLAQMISAACEERDTVLAALNEATDILEDQGRPEGERISKGIAAIVEERERAMNDAFTAKWRDEEKRADQYKADSEVWDFICKTGWPTSVNVALLKIADHMDCPEHLRKRLEGKT